MVDQCVKGWAVFDTETTGFSPRKGARIIEIAVVQVTPEGEIENVWETLINPCGPVGPTDIHRIDQGMVRNAPTFDMIAGDIAELFEGRIPVAHNLPFDRRFLEHHFEEIGHPVEMGGVCTLKWARKNIPGSQKLAAMCQHYGVSLSGAHRASADAVATAQLLPHLNLPLSEITEWPRLAPSRMTYPRP